MKRSIQKSLLALALTALCPSHGKTQIFVEAGLANQTGSAEGSGSGQLSNSVTPINYFGAFPVYTNQAFVTNGGSGFIYPSNVKAIGGSINTGLHHFFPLTSSWLASLGFSMGYTFLKAQFTPKQTHVNQANAGPGINGVQSVYNVLNANVTPICSSTVSTAPDINTVVTPLLTSTATSFSFKEKGYVEIAPVVGLKYKDFHFVAKVGYAYHLISMTPGEIQMRFVDGKIFLPNKAVAIPQLVNAQISLSSKGANCFIIGGGVYMSVTPRADLGITGAWHVGSIRIKGMLTTQDYYLSTQQRKLKITSRFQSLEMGVLFRYNFSVSSPEKAS
jgi:hypothetical protein